MIGYRSDRDQERIALNKRLRGMHPEIIARTEAAIAEVQGLKSLFTDENFVTLLRAEGLDTLPKYLADRIETI